jgi:predicted hydrocarbon binding protein
LFNLYYKKAFFGNQIKWVHNNLFLSDFPLLIVPIDALIELVARNDEELNKKIYYSVKKGIAFNFVPGFKFKPSFDLLSRVKIVEEFFSYSGWGKVLVRDVDEKEKHAIVTVEDSPIAFALQNKSLKPVDHFLRGVIAGIFSNVFHSNVDCLEIKCVSNGSIQNCEFVVKPNPEFDFSKELTHTQIDPKI